MKIEYTYTKYPGSPWLTFFSKLQSSLGLFGFTIPLGLIPGIIGVATGVPGPVRGVLFISGIIVSFFAWVIFILRLDLDKMYQKKIDSQTREFEPEPQKNIRETYVDNLYRIIDATWAKADDQALYQRFQTFKPQVKQALAECYENMANIPKCHEDSHTFNMVALFQCFALSYVLVLNLQSCFSKYDLNDVTKTMAAVFLEDGYLNGKSGLITDYISFMVTEKKAIVRATLKKHRKTKKKRT